MSFLFTVFAIIHVTINFDNQKTSMTKIKKAEKLLMQMPAAERSIFLKKLIDLIGIKNLYIG
jgi:hypothetical protein